MSDIRLEGVTRRYGTVAAADNVDLAVAHAGKYDTVPKRTFNERVLEANPTIISDGDALGARHS